MEDDRFDCGACRYRAMGYIGDRLHVVVFTPRGDAVHVISFRKTNKREVKNYDQKPRPEKVDTANSEWSAEDFAKARASQRGACGVVRQSSGEGNAQTQAWAAKVGSH
ncbi:BrnT family toxin [Pseudomonas sp.]|uniref:BrnT family toxin n=1 Tax=Pseudomonas sp. TaxID=306 RepID=UPI0034A528B8